MTDVQIVCATPRTGKPAPRGAPEPKPTSKEKTVKQKLPLPPIPEAKQAASAVSGNDPGPLPDFLDREKNPLPPSKPVAAPVPAKPVNPVNPADEKAKAEIVAEQEAKKATKAKVRAEKRAAVASGATKAMPLEGKAALAAIRGESLPPKEPPIKARAKAPQKPTGAKKPAAGGKTKLAIIAALLARKGGTTTAEVLKATGWPSVSMPQQAKAAGLKLRKEKKPGEVTRYFAG